MSLSPRTSLRRKRGLSHAGRSRDTAFYIWSKCIPGHCAGREFRDRKSQNCALHDFSPRVAHVCSVRLVHISGSRSQDKVAPKSGLNEHTFAQDRIRAWKDGVASEVPLIAIE